MRCPGQDRRYWKEDAVFEAACPKCDTPVEFFKDESTGRCPSCGHRFGNPKMTFDCAQWCQYAEECLGFVPERRLSANPGKGALASRLIQAIKQELQTDQARLARSLRSFEHARELLATEGGDPRTILAASLLLELARDETEPPQAAAQRTAKAKGLAKATRILKHVGLDDDTVECVCRVLESYRIGRELDTIESRIVQDADTLTKLTAADSPSDPHKLQQVIDTRLKTNAARAKARRLFQA